MKNNFFHEFFQLTAPLLQAAANKIEALQQRLVSVRNHCLSRYIRNMLYRLILMFYLAEAVEATTIQENSTKSPNFIEYESLMIIGRLASTIAHEIGNSMQVIRGALALAVENPEDLQDVLA